MIISFINTSAQQISTTKFGDILRDMNYEQVSNLYSKKNSVLETTNKDMPEQNITVNGVAYNVIYYKNLKTNKLEVYSVSSSSKNLSTLSGIKVGSTLSDLWLKYKKYDITLRNDYETKTGRVFELNDIDNGSALLFYLVNNKITKIKLVNESAYLNNNIYEN